jgi:hypothetical protein
MSLFDEDDYGANDYIGQLVISVCNKCGVGGFPQVFTVFLF